MKSPRALTTAHESGFGSQFDQGRLARRPWWPSELPGMMLTGLSLAGEHSRGQRTAAVGQCASAFVPGGMRTRSDCVSTDQSRGSGAGHDWMQWASCSGALPAHGRRAVGKQRGLSLSGSLVSSVDEEGASRQHCSLTKSHMNAYCCGLGLRVKRSALTS